MIGVTAKIPVQDGKQAEFENVFKDLTEKVLANEPGCKMYQLCKAKGSDTDYVVMEVYESEDALAAHGKTEHFRAAQPALGGCVAGAPDISILTFV